MYKPQYCDEVCFPLSGMESCLIPCTAADASGKGCFSLPFGAYRAPDCAACSPAGAVPDGLLPLPRADFFCKMESDIFRKERIGKMTKETMQEPARQAFLVDTLQKLLGQDSPTGFTEKVVTVAEGIARELGFATRRTNKGNLVVTVPGREAGRKVGLCAHVDTLGLMVRSVTADGMLMVTRVGGPLLPTLDGEYCRIYTREGKVYTGTVLSLSPSVHVQDDAATRPRDEKNMAVRIDEKVHSKEDVLALGIAAGDYVCYDPKTTVTESGFVKSRFLDDKASAACLLTLLWQMRETGVRPRFETYFTFTVHEEVGHGGATLPTVDELLAVDMGCIGEDLSCTEYQVSICAKDNGGPYDYGMVSRLVQLAKEQGVDYAVDIYPHYGSDVGAAWRAGMDCRAALIGPGVHASHGMERTHLDGLNATMHLAALYLELA